MLELTQAAEEGHHVVNELFVDPFMFGVFAIVAFLAMAAVTYMFHRTSHNHPEESDVSPLVPYVHPGHAAHD